MTTRAITLRTPFLDLATFASTRTARASHAQALAELVSDAAGGHPRQRGAIDRNSTGGTYHVMLRRGVARYLLIRLAVGFKGSWNALDELDVDLSISDGTTTITSADARIPVGLKADTGAQAVSVLSDQRLDVLGHRSWVLDLADFESGGTSLSGTTRTLTFVVSITGTNTYCEGLWVEELPRWVIDDAEDYGALPELYLARGVIKDSAAGVQRLWETARFAYTHGIRTYHQLARREADPWSIVATDLSPSAAWPGDEESAGVARKYVVRARTMRGTTDPRVAFRVRYRLAGASPGDQGYVTLVTGAGSYTLTLTDASGAWAEAEAQGYLDATNAEQQVSFKGHVDAGVTALEIDARHVFDDPA